MAGRIETKKSPKCGTECISHRHPTPRLRAKKLEERRGDSIGEPRGLQGYSLPRKQRDRGDQKKQASSERSKGEKVGSVKNASWGSKAKEKVGGRPKNSEKVPINRGGNFPKNGGGRKKKKKRSEEELGGARL